MLKRIFDIILSILLIMILLPFFLLIMILVKLEDGQSIFHLSKRIGQNNKIFFMIKFRTMKNNTPDVATHLLKNPEQYLTKIGKFLRKTSLDELPQLYNVFTGKMSMVGPRPALHNQDELINLRSKLKIQSLLPGITGWAQINGRDSISIKKKVELDYYYLKKKNIYFDIFILFSTLKKIFYGKNVNH